MSGWWDDDPSGYDYSSYDTLALFWSSYSAHNDKHVITKLLGSWLCDPRATDENGRTDSPSPFGLERDTTYYTEPMNVLGYLDIVRRRKTREPII